MIMAYQVVAPTGANVGRCDCSASPRMLLRRCQATVPEQIRSPTGNRARGRSGAGLGSTGNANLMTYLIIADPNFPIVPRVLMLARGGVG